MNYFLYSSESHHLGKGQVLLLLISFKKATKGNWQGKS